MSKRLLPILISAVLAALAAGTAAAMPLLRASVIVGGPVVTAGDLFDDAGVYADAPLFRSPEPGTVGALGLAAIQTAASRAGILEFDPGAIAVVRVERSGTAIDLALVTALIAAELRTRGEMDDVTELALALDAPLGRLYATPANAAPATLFDLATVPSAARFAARILIAGSDRPLQITGSYQLIMSVPHLVSSLGAGDVIGPNDIEMRPVPVYRLGGQAALAPEEVLGKAVRRSMRAGNMLMARDIAAAILVTRNQIVSLTYRSGPLTLTARGQALADGALGEQVAVLNQLSKKVVQGTVAGPGTVSVGPFDLHLADAS